MMKHFIISFLLLSLASGANAQRQSTACTDEPNQRALHENPVLQKQWDQFNAAFLEYLKTADLSKFKVNSGNTLGKTAKPKYIIPIVFHIMHNGGVENYSDQDIMTEVATMNKNYSANSDFRSRIRPIFKDIEANAQIEFRLAKIKVITDSTGKIIKSIPTTGIDKYYVGNQTNKANDAQKLNSWDPQRYLNVWTVGSIQD